MNGAVGEVETMEGKAAIIGLANRRKKADIFAPYSCVADGKRLENRWGMAPVERHKPREGDHHVTTSNRIEASSVAHHRGVGLRAEIRASFPSGDSGGEIILVRLHRLRAWRQSAG